MIARQRATRPHGLTARTPRRPSNAREPRCTGNPPPETLVLSIAPAACGTLAGMKTGAMDCPPTGASLSRVVRVATIRPALTIAVGLALALAALVFAGHALAVQSPSVQLQPPPHLDAPRRTAH